VQRVAWRISSYRLRVPLSSCVASALVTSSPDSISRAVAGWIACSQRIAAGRRAHALGRIATCLSFSQRRHAVRRVYPQA